MKVSATQKIKKKKQTLTTKKQMAKHDKERGKVEIQVIFH
jgi:hypothetical protein